MRDNEELAKCREAYLEKFTASTAAAEAARSIVNSKGARTPPGTSELSTANENPSPLQPGEPENEGSGDDSEDEDAPPDGYIEARNAPSTASSDKDGEAGDGATEDAAAGDQNVHGA